MAAVAYVAASSSRRRATRAPAAAAGRHSFSRSPSPARRPRRRAPPEPELELEWPPALTRQPPSAAAAAWRSDSAAASAAARAALAASECGRRELAEPGAPRGVAQAPPPRAWRYASVALAAAALLLLGHWSADGEWGARGAAARLAGPRLAAAGGWAFNRSLVLARGSWLPG
jgi:hypothetical protein